MVPVYDDLRMTLYSPMLIRSTIPSPRSSALSELYSVCMNFMCTHFLLVLHLLLLFLNFQVLGQAESRALLPERYLHVSLWFGDSFYSYSPPPPSPFPDLGPCDEQWGPFIKLNRLKLRGPKGLGTQRQGNRNYANIFNEFYVRRIGPGGRLA